MERLSLQTPYLTADQLKRFPSIMATEPAGRTSSRYSFIPTTRVIEQFEKAGFYPVKVQEARAGEDRVGYQRHLIRFRQKGLEAVAVDQIFPEIVLTNSHDAGAAFRLMMGIFRLVCSNGAVVSESTLNSYAIHHVGYTDQAVHEAIGGISERLPLIMGRVDEFKALEMTPDDRGVFALRALSLKHGEEALLTREFNLPELIRPVRAADQASHLWNAYNTVQEKLIEKGAKIERRVTRERYNRRTGRMEGVVNSVRTRGVQAPAANIKLNQAFWDIAEKASERLKNQGHWEPGTPEQIMKDLAKKYTGQEDVGTAREIMAERKLAEAVQG